SAGDQWLSARACNHALSGGATAVAVVTPARVSARCPVSHAGRAISLDRCAGAGAAAASARANLHGARWRDHPPLCRHFLVGIPETSVLVPAFALRIPASSTMGV